MLDDRVVDGKRVLPCNAEDVVDTNLVESLQDVLDNTFSHDVISIREVHEPSGGEGSKIAHRQARTRLARLHQRAAFPAHTSSTSGSGCRTRLEGQPVHRT